MARVSDIFFLFSKESKSEKTRNVTVYNKCPRRPLKMTLIPGCDIEHSQGTSLAQAISCHFVLLFYVTLTLAKNLNFDYDMFTFS